MPVSESLNPQTRFTWFGCGESGSFSSLTENDCASPVNHPGSFNCNRFIYSFDDYHVGDFYCACLNLVHGVAAQLELFSDNLV